MNKRIVQLVAAFVTLTGALVLLGWQLNVDWLKSGYPGSPSTMKANTALCFLLAGVALGLWQTELKIQNAKLKKRLKFLIFNFALLILLTGLLTLGQYRFGWNLGIDQLLAQDINPSATTLYPGRMGEITAFNFMLVGTALLLRQKARLVQGLSVLVALLTLLPLTSHIFGASIAYETVLRTKTVALYTAVAFMALCAGILLTQPDRGIMQTFTSPLVGGIMARRLLSWAIAFPLVVNWLTFWGEKHGWYDPAFGYACRVVIMTSVVSVLIWRTARSLNQIDRDRTHAEQLLRDANKTLEMHVADRTVDLLNANHRLQIELIERTQAEQALQESEFKFRALFDQSFQFVGLVSPDGILFELNQPTLKLIAEFGEKALGRLFWDRAVWGEAGKTRLKEAISKALTGEIVRLEIPLYAPDNTILRHPNGNVVVHDIAFKAVKNASDQVMFLIVEGRDISDFKHLEVSRARLAAIVESSDDAIISKSLDGIVTSWNWGAEKLFGYSAAEMIGQSITRLVPPERLYEISQILQKIQQNQSLERYETVRLHKDGQRIDISVTISPIKDASGKVIGASAVKRDISDRKRTEEILRQYERIVSVSTDAISLLDRDYHYRVVNQTYLTWHQKAYTEIVGHSVSDLLGQELFERAVKPRLDQCLTGETIQYELWVNFAGIGHQFVSVTYTPYAETDGTISGVVVSLRNMTQLQQAQTALQQSQERLQLAFEASGDGLWDWNIATGEVYHNPQYFEMLGYATDEIAPDFSNWESLVHPDDMTGVTQVLANHLQDRSVPFRCDYRLQAKSGRWEWVTDYGKVVAWDEQGNPTRMIGTHRSIGDRKRTEEALRQYERIVSASTDAISLVDRDYIYRAINQTYMVWHQKSYAEIIGHSISDLVGQTLFETTIKPRLDQCFTGKIVQFEHWVNYPTLGLQFISVTYAPYLEPDGTISAVVVSLRNITPLKQAEAALQQSEERLQLAFEASGDGLWDWSILTGEVYFSPQYFEMLGYATDELPQTLATWEYLVHPDDMTWVGEILTAHLHDHASPYAFDYRLRAKSGEWKWVADYGKVVAWDQQGNPTRMIGTHRDIDKRKRAEELLRQSEARNRALINSVPDLLIRSRADGTYLDFYSGGGVKIASPAQLYKGTNIYNVLPQDLAQERMQYIQQALQTGAIQVYEYTISVAGVSYIEEARIVACGDDEVLIIIRDITRRKRTEAALQESEARFQAFMNNSPAASWITDGDGRLLYISQTYSRIFQYDSEAVGKTVFDLYPAEIAQQFLDNIQTVAKTGQTLETIEQAPKLDNTIGDFLVYKFPVQASTGELMVGGIAIDVTDRKRAEALIRANEERLRLVIQATNDAVWDWDYHTEQVWWGNGYQTLFGYDLATIDHSLDFWLDQLHPDDLTVFLASYTNAIKHNHPAWNVECRFRRADGSWADVLTRGYVMQDERGRVFRCIGSMMDISDRKQIEAERQQAEKELQLQAIIARNMAEGICLVRATDAAIVYANPKFEQLFGYDPGELIGKNVSIVNYENAEQSAAEAATRIIQEILTHGASTYEVHNVKKDGTPFWCQATASIFGHPDYGDVVVAVQQDITDRKRSQDFIKASLKEKEVLLKEIHHRVKNNLGIVSSLLQMQLRRTEDPQASAILRDSQNRIASIALVHEKLYRSIDLANIDFAQYLSDLATHLFASYDIHSSRVQLKTSIAPVCLDIETAIPCGLILNELISNALKYAFPGDRAGEIQIRLEQQSDATLSLLIQDNGVGLPPDFDPKTTKTLGIKLVQGLVRQLKGAIEINRQSGTEFKISFQETIK